jgi:lipopolysaccharide/colanic/teichoic acid biosynthesis glycosyltransferase
MEQKVAGRHRSKKGREMRQEPNKVGSVKTGREAFEQSPDEGLAGSREELLESLGRLYSQTGLLQRSRTSRFRFRVKRLLWTFVVGGVLVLKRAVDIVGSAALLFLLLPLFGVLAATIKLTDGGPVLFWQRRVGKWGQEFDMPKFRSMVANPERLETTLKSDNPDSIRFKMKKDPRITRVGRIIRKLSIDELPQLWNVLKGQMSLVGPRPPIPSEVAEYCLYDRQRLNVIPGLTCIWQVSGRSDIPFEDQVRLDVQYIENRSFWLDIKILLQTIPAVLTGKGAY